MKHIISLLFVLLFLLTSCVPLESYIENILNERDSADCDTAAPSPTPTASPLLTPSPSPSYPPPPTLKPTLKPTPEPSPTFKPESPDFQNAYWGMSREAARKTERPVMRTSDIYQDTYHDLKYEGLDAYVIYHYDEYDSLRIGSYIITETDNFLETKDKLKSKLIKLYGNPIEDETTWHSRLFENTPEKYDLAVTLGHLEYQTTWYNGRSFVILILYGDGSEACLDVIYYDAGYILDMYNSPEYFDQII